MKLYLHTIKDSKINYQAEVLEDLGNGVFEVQLFGWLLGEITDIINIDTKVTHCIFYTGEDAWIDSAKANGYPNDL